MSTSDIPGLVIEASTLSEFEPFGRDLAPEMSAENGGLQDPIRIEFEARSGFELAVA